jgi:hypothetical protein
MRNGEAGHASKYNKNLQAAICIALTESDNNALARIYGPTQGAYLTASQSRSIEIPKKICRLLNCYNRGHGACHAEFSEPRFGQGA